MTWNPATETDVEIAQAVVLWITTARAAGYGDNWLPMGVAVHKSALFERIRSGKDPLEFPPPVAFSCPWYALVEEPTPHNVGDGENFGPHFYTGQRLMPENTVNIFQSLYDIVEKTSDTDMIVKDRRHETPYRFRLWFDAEWRRPNAGDERAGAWFMAIVEGVPAA